MSVIIEHHGHALRRAEVYRLVKSMKDEKNRMVGLNKFFKDRTGEGDFHSKNIAEALSAQKLVEWTSEELACLKNGPGASKYWQFTDYTRADFVDAVQNMFDKVHTVQVVWKNDRASTVALTFAASDLNAEVAQFWACAQTRIHRVYERLTRRHRTVVPTNLMPNADLRALMAKTWEADGYEDDEDGDDGC